MRIRQWFVRPAKKHENTTQGANIRYENCPKVFGNWMKATKRWSGSFLNVNELRGHWVMQKNDFSELKEKVSTVFFWNL